MCGFDSDFLPECKSKSISGGFIHQAGIFGVKCFSIYGVAIICLYNITTKNEDCINTRYA